MHVSASPGIAKLQVKSAEVNSLENHNVVGDYFQHDFAALRPVERRKKSFATEQDQSNKL